MNETLFAVVILGVAMVAAAVVYLMMRQRSQKLRSHFGPEYERTLEGYGSRREAERALVDRARRVQKLEIRPLPALRREEFAGHWQAVQAQFVDDPASALREAHTLLSAVMHEQGYPTGRLDEEIELLSVHHPAAVQHYRAAWELAEQRGRGQLDTEDLRQAMIHYRALFEDLLKLGAPRASRAPEVR